TPLILASQNSQLQLSRVLLEAGALVDLQDAMGMTAFLKASAHAMIPLCDLLIKHDCNINHQDRDGWTALHEACKQGNLKMAHYLVSHGAVANCQDHLLQTPLHVCVPFLNAGHMIRMLVVEARASLEIGDIHGKTPLHVAVDQGNAPICETLIELGAD
ncbi:ankyrin repeat-containing domain protein, partial [Gorgonomyces haynaldii]